MQQALVMNRFTFVYVTILVFSLLIQANGQQQFPGTYKLIKTSDCPTNLDIYKPNSNGQWPQNVFTSNFEPSIGKKVRLDIRWTADITNLKGFKIVLKPTGKPDICRILDYTDAITNSSSGLYSFSFTFRSIYENKLFKTELYSLPSRDNSSASKTFDTIVCSQFSPNFTYTYDGQNMNVILTTGPARCNYKEYCITVYANKTEVIKEVIIPTKDNAKQLDAFFELEICKGLHFLLVSVYDRYYNDNQKCACKDSENTCQRCQNSKSDPVYLTPVKPCLPRVQSPDKQESNQFLFPLGIVIGLLLLIALTLSITHWKLSVHLMVKKRGLVLLIDDHEHHTNAVIKLVNYLNGCHLKMDLASTFLKNYDIPDQLLMIGEALKSDFVLLVLSSALQKRMEAWNKEQDYVEFFRETNSNILTKHLLEVFLKSNKIYVCKFDHMPEFGHWPKPCYSLPSGLTNMTADLNGQSFSQRLIRLNYCKSNSLWSELQAAIKKSVMYEQSHVNWFQEKYVCPQKISQIETIGT